MTQAIRNVLIVGGGTAGWLTAGFLAKTLGGTANTGVRITLVESREIGIIGVGEGTFPSIRGTLSALGIPEESITRHGAVSEETARAMAIGAARVTGAAYAVSTTGIAGPSGGTADKPVGLVWFGIRTPSGVTCERREFFGDRAGIRTRATMFATGALAQQAPNFAAVQIKATDLGHRTWMLEGQGGNAGRTVLGVGARVA